MVATTYHPKISVRLHKLIGRDSIGGTAASTRFQGNTRTIDLTPFLGEGGSVRTSKNIREPAGGFNITLADKMFMQAGSGLAQLETLYGLIEPMDVIEIRMAHEPHAYRGQGLTDNLPIVMRGFVSEVRRVEGVSQDGKPQRSVVISGQDYGKILQIMQIIYFPNYVLGQNLLTNYRLFVNYGIGFSPNQPAGQFVAEVIEKVVNPYLAQLASRNGSGGGGEVPSVSQMTVDAQVQRGTVSPFGANAWQGGTIYELLRYFGDVGPFNELFVDDREDAVALVYRPNPFIDLDGNRIQPGAALPVTTITEKDVAGLTVGRSDSNIANYYWVDAPRYQMVNADILRLTASSGDPDSFLLFDYPNSTPDLYGIRKMEVTTQQGDSAEQTRGDGQSEAETDADRERGISWLEDRRRVLMDQNKDNVLFESGNMLLRGNERIKPGTTVRLRRREFTADCYVFAVDHNFTPFGAFTTTVHFERGRGFIERVTDEQAPYLAELTAGGVYD